ncbi:AMP-binding protein [Polyangium sp. 6x1]|uniref:AMP-binding protein n=1 Tax=Polyangium sp. 6x1 TaxID=3042689 RepID=UPI0024827C73|nr:AMP-binding protein [Polyangium sp. 6x1]MDI1443343.1 AMP-binding protein [Polyangium sp. 6x1]
MSETEMNGGLGAQPGAAGRSPQAMNGAATITPLLPSRVLSGKRLVVVGGTGFLGKVWVSMLLHRFPEIGHLYLLVRPKAGQSAEERFWSQIATSASFDPIREAHPGAEFEAWIAQKITAIAGDIVHHECGLDKDLLARIDGTIDAVVNVAGVVDFNPPLDEALEVNAFGVTNLVSLARRLQAPILHTSTCYVAGYRSGLIEEVDPREVPFPRAEGETWFGAGIAERTLDRSHWDPQREIDECLDLVKQARHRCEDAFRQSAFLDEAKENLQARGEPGRGTALDAELAKVKRRFIENQLTEAGTERAHFWGWTNIYTYTKSIGEQVLAASGVPYTIVRPAVIESSCVYPFPGWNEGINTSAPFIYMAMQGQVQMPGDHRVHLDIIPCDMVTSGMIASLCELLEGKAPAVYQYGTTDTNGCRMTRYYELMGLYKRKLAYEGKRSALFDWVKAYFEPVGLTKKQYEQRGSHQIAKAMNTLGGVLGKLAGGPVRPLLKPASDMLLTAAKAEEKMAGVMDIFLPFVAEADWVFSCANTRAAMARMPEDERAKFYWEPEKLDWRWFMWEIHIPGLEKWVFPLIDEKQNKQLKALRKYDQLIDLIEEMAERHDHAVALQLLTDEGLTRTTFRELRDGMLATAARLAAVGVRPGDRVLLAGENQPAWPVAYFGILRAGAVAVPVDPALEERQLANILRSSGARVALWDRFVEEKGGKGARASNPELRVYDLPSFADPDAHEQLSAPEVTIKGEHIASIIYTSGTTGDPKGVMLSHDNFTALLAALAPIFPLAQHDRILSVLPLHHTFEFTCGLLLPISRGTRIIYIGELSGERVSKGLKEGRITAMVGVPALWQMLERRVTSRVKEQGPAAAAAFDWALELNRLLGEKAGLNLGRLFFGTVHKALGGNVRFLISGGAALPKDTANVFRGLGLPLSEGYGLTEAAPVLTVAKASPSLKPGTVGKPIPNVEIKIDKPDAGGVGEVLARGPNVMLGYAGNEEATSAAIDEAGWLHTGDLGKLDKKGRLVIVGRKKDVIVTASGENVYPDDVEDILGGTPHVREIAIVGIDDGQGGERVACLAVPERDEGEPAEGEKRPSRAERHEKAMKALREAFQKLPKVAQPSVVHLWDHDLPRTATRKVKRSEVKSVLAKLASASAMPAGEGGGQATSASARHAIATIANKKSADLTPGMSLRGDLRFDSLMAMELAAALEAQTGRAIDTDRLSRCDTVGDVEALVVELGGEAAHEVELAKVDEGEEEPIKLPKPLADAAKQLLGKAQANFYDRVMHPKVYGRAYIPHNRNTIVASNHASHLDMGFVKYALGAYGDELVSLAAQDYFFESGKWRRAWFENLTNLAPFDRKGGLRQALRQAGDLLDQGNTILIFPEGTRSTDGQIHEFGAAIGHLALHHEVDILPVWLGGTYEALPKGANFPKKRDLVARVGPPLEVRELKRLTAGMKTTVACRKVAELTRQAVVLLKEGKVLDIRQIDRIEEATPKQEHPLVVLFRDLETKFVPGRVNAPVTYYFTLGNENEAKWTLRIEPNRCEAKMGKPEGAAADCVLKTSPEIFLKIVREAYTPSPMEFMSGAVKSNDISLLLTFQKVFDLA